MVGFDGVLFFDGGVRAEIFLEGTHVVVAVLEQPGYLYEAAGLFLLLVRFCETGCCDSLIELVLRSLLCDICATDKIKVALV